MTTPTDYFRAVARREMEPAEAARRMIDDERRRTPRWLRVLRFVGRMVFA